MAAVDSIPSFSDSLLFLFVALFTCSFRNAFVGPGIDCDYLLSVVVVGGDGGGSGGGGDDGGASGSCGGGGGGCGDSGGGGVVGCGIS